MERTGPSPRRPPVKRTTTERSPHPSTQQQSQHQFLASAAGKRPDNRISPSTARQQQLSNNAPSGQHQNAEGELENTPPNRRNTILQEQKAATDGAFTPKVHRDSIFTAQTAATRFKNAFTHFSTRHRKTYPIYLAISPRMSRSIPFPRLPASLPPPSPRPQTQGPERGSRKSSSPPSLETAPPPLGSRPRCPPRLPPPPR